MTAAIAQKHVQRSQRFHAHKRDSWFGDRRGEKVIEEILHERKRTVVLNILEQEPRGDALSVRLVPVLSWRLGKP